MFMRCFYIVLWVSLSFVKLNATEISTVIVSDTILLQRMMQIDRNDSSTLATFYQENEVLKNSLSIEDFNTVFSILHINPDSTYQNNQKTYVVAQMMADKFFLVNNQIMKAYASFSSKDSGKFLEYNMKKYLSRIIFQWFYEKGTQNELLKSEVQEALQPKVIDEMIKKDKNLQQIQDALTFLARNSIIKLFVL